jgi:hypothetical protein
MSFSSFSATYRENAVLPKSIDLKTSAGEKVLLLIDALSAVW